MSLNKLMFFLILTIPSLYAQGIIKSLTGAKLPDTYALGLSVPKGIDIDLVGNIFISDSRNNQILKINHQGDTSLVAGVGSAGFSGDGGLATQAEIDEPQGLVISPLGDIYFADGNNERIRKIDAGTGVISTIAGNGVRGFGGDEGLAINAQFNNIKGLALDTFANLYVADSDNNRIRRINLNTDTITTIAGIETSGEAGAGGLATLAELSTPFDVEINAAGDLFIVTYGSHKVYRIDEATNLISVIAGTGNDGYSGDGSLAINAELKYPTAVELDSLGNIYIADKGNDCIRKIEASSGIITTVVGNGDDDYYGDGGLATLAALNGPVDIAISPNGDLYITEDDNDVVRKVNASDSIISTLNHAGGFSEDGVHSDSTQMQIPMDIVLDSVGNIFYSDEKNNRIRMINKATNKVSTVAGTGSPGSSGDGGLAIDAKLYRPRGLAFDSEWNLYVADTFSHKIRKIDRLTGIITTIAGEGTGSSDGDGGLAISASFRYPSRIDIDDDNNIYIVENSSYKVRKINYATGIVNTIIGTGRYGTSADGGQAIDASFRVITDILIGSGDSLFITESSGHRIRIVDLSTGILSTYAGANYNGTGENGDGGLALNAYINYPVSLAFDLSGSLYIGTGDNRIRKIDGSTKIITTVAGNGIEGFSGDSALATNARLNHPSGIAVANDGILYFVDSENHRIRYVDFRILPSIEFPSISNKTYGDTLILTAIAGPSSSDIEFNSTTERICVVQNSVVYFVDVGTCEVSVNQKGDSTYQAAFEKTQSILVNPAILNIKIDSATKIYGDTLDVFTYQTSGWVNEDDISVFENKLTVSTTATLDSDVGVYPLYLDEVDLGDFNKYSISYENDSLYITPRVLTISNATATDKIYDGTTTAIIENASLSNVYGSDDVVLNLGIANFDSKNTGESIAVTVQGSSLSGTDATNYSLTGVSGLTADINNKELTITVNDASVVQGSELPTLTHTISGFVGGEEVELTSVLYITSYDESTLPGKYDIGLEADEISNYEFNIVYGELSVKELLVMLNEVPVKTTRIANYGVYDLKGNLILSGKSTSIEDLRGYISDLGFGKYVLKISN